MQFSVRKWLVGVSGAIALSLTLVPTALAADMTLTPDSTVCAPSDYPANCGELIGVNGHGFPPNLAQVDLYWVEPAFFPTAAGFPGAIGQQASGTACRTFGTPMAPSPPITTDGSGSFDGVTVTGPPEGVNAVYGANAICAVWQDSGGAYRGFGNQYTIYPF
jgi:hypothetical protein